MVRTIITAIVVSFMHFCSSGQAAVYFFAGPQTATARYRIKNVGQPTDFKFGIHAGVGMKVNFDEHLFFSPALSYSQTGYKVSFDRPSFPPDSSAKNNNTNMHQADIDLALQYDLGNKPGHFFIKAGPSFNVIVSGREKFQVMSGETISRDMKFGLYSRYGRFLASFRTCVGYETATGYFFALEYVHGLSSINNADNGPQILQRVIAASVGILLHSKKIVLDTKNRE